ncbi:MAG: Hint domain-containing protein [Pirellulaceae bacterium]|nr:Hint domain-containing protein [Pirellulaceae bacterium]
MIRRIQSTVTILWMALRCANGSPADLQALGDRHRQVSAALMSLTVMLSDSVKEMTPAERGRVMGAITWEVAQTLAEILFTGGVASVATKGAKFAHIADKLNDFAKSAKGFGKTAELALAKLKVITGEVGELRKLLNKFDEATVTAAHVVSEVADTLEKFCFAPETLVATPNGRKTITSIVNGDEVLSYDDSSASWKASKVTHFHRNLFTGKLVSISLGDSTIQVTGNHPFWIVDGKALDSRPAVTQLKGEELKSLKGGRWIAAENVQTGDSLVLRAGKLIRVESIACDDVFEFEVCNLTVEGLQNFAVGYDEILTHNEGFCGALTQYTQNLGKRAEFVAARKRLAEQFGYGDNIGRIHGHHIIQNLIPKQIHDVVGGQRIGSYDKVDLNWSISQQKAWYINDLHIVAKKHGIAEKAANETAKAGKTLLNLTLAPNGNGTHTLETQKEVWERLNDVRDSESQFKKVLEEIGKEFLQGALPRP